MHDQARPAPCTPAATLSVVVPQYRTRAAVPELVRRLGTAMAGSGHLVEVVFVDDACPQRSYEAVIDAASSPDLPSHLRLRALRLAVNCGQHAAVVAGLSCATGTSVAVMDGDLQDTPEGLRELLDRFAVLHRSDAGPDALAARRSGTYESAGRQMTARLFRRALHAQSRGRIPADAGLFMVMTSEAVRRVLALDDPAVHVLAALGRTGATVQALPVQRVPRPTGRSSYSALLRLKSAVRILCVNTPLQPAIAARRRRSAPVPREIALPDNSRGSTP